MTNFTRTILVSLILITASYASTAEAKLKQVSPLIYEKNVTAGSTITFSVSVKLLGLMPNDDFYAGIILSNSNEQYELYGNPVGIYRVYNNSTKQIDVSVVLPDNEGVYMVSVLLFRTADDSLSLRIYGNPLLTIGTADSDNDGMPDGWENLFSLNTEIDDSNDDNDNDGLTNIQEYECATFPVVMDSDNDGLSDYFEIGFDNDYTSYNWYTDLNPLNKDTDFDNLSDLYEISFDNDSGSYNPLTDTNPLSDDTDNDGVTDDAEIASLYQFSINDGFESGDFSSLQWERWNSGGDHFWEVTDEVKYEGSYAAATPESLLDGEQCNLYITVELLDDTNFSFYYKISPQPLNSSVPLSLWINSTKINLRLAEFQWTKYEGILNEGMNTVRFEYSKYGDKQAWIDAFTIEPTSFRISPLLSDTDNDGMNDRDEITAGMQPDNPESIFKIVSFNFDNVFNGNKLTWIMSPKTNRLYSIFWKENTGSQWDKIDYEDWNLDVIDNGDGTMSWIDFGLDSEMPSSPEESSSRLYKIIVEKSR